MKKGIIVLSIIFTFLCLNLTIFNSNCLAESNHSQEQLKQFTEKYGKDVKIRFDKSGRPIRIRNIKTAASEGKPEDIALSFLTENSSFLDINLANLKFKKVRETKRGNNVIFSQIYKGLPVQDKVVRVNLSKQGEIKFVRSNYHPHADIDINPQIATEQAMAAVRADLGVEKLLQVTKIFLEKGICKDEISTPVPELIIVPGAKSGLAYLAWRFKFLQKDTSNYWYYAIDAHTGKIIHKRDIAMTYSTDGYVDGHIYSMDGDDDPGSQDLENVYATIECLDGSWWQTGSDYTDDNGNLTISYPSEYLYHRIIAGTMGSTCVVYNYSTSSIAQQIKGNWLGEIPSIQYFALNYTPGASNSYFDCVNVYYHISESFEEFYDDTFNYDLGYTITAVTHWGPDSDNAAYIPYPYRYLWFGDGGTYLKNTAHAKDVILHELQHAVTDECYHWFPAADPNAFEVAAMEAYSDYFAATQCGDFLHGDWVCKIINKNN